MTTLAREMLTKDFWITGIAIARYIPKALRTKEIDGMAFFTQEKRDEFHRRVAGITPEARRVWGTMTVAQILHHLNLACGSSLGFYKVPDESYFLSRHVFRWILVDWFPEQPVGLRLPKGFKIPHDEQFDFNFEKTELLQILDVAGGASNASDWAPHCMFGPMTPKQWGKLLQIHVDYHLRQFDA